jgi:signal peptidase I
MPGGSTLSKKATFTGFGFVLLFILGFAVFFYFNFRTVVVDGRSMEPTFHSGQRVLASQAYWLVGGIRDRDVVVVKVEGGTGYIIKRVYKQGGEIVDWENVPEEWSLLNGEYRVPAGQLYVLGDNREVSEDSRQFGAIPLEKVIGKIIKR